MNQPISRVAGYYAGRCVIQPLDPAAVLPEGLALYAAAPAAPVVQEEPVAWALPDPDPKPGRPFLVLFHSTSQVNDPSALVPLYASPQPVEQQTAPCQECGGDGAGGEHEDDCAMAQPAEQQPDVTHLVEALRNMLAAFDNPIARRKMGSEFSQQAIESAHEALGSKGGAQPAELNHDDLTVDVWGIAPRHGFDMRNGSAVRITHIPTGISVVRSAERSQHANKEAALAVLTRLVAALSGKGGA